MEANWHQDGVKKESYFNRKIRNKTYLVKYDKMLNWTLTNETKKIENYTCFKATIIQKNLETGVEFIREAWYTTEIPVPYGPVGFGGLPGLILELKTGKAIFTAKKIVLNPKKGIKPYPKANMENPIGRKELPKLMRAARKVTED